MSRAQYALLNYLLPFLWILTAELYAVFSKGSEYTITGWLTSLPSSLLYALTGFAAVWTSVHWVQTYRTKAERKKREKGESSG
jgi:hypothetical protein